MAWNRPNRTISGIENSKSKRWRNCTVIIGSATAVALAVVIWFALRNPLFTKSDTGNSTGPALIADKGHSGGVTNKLNHAAKAIQSTNKVANGSAPSTNRIAKHSGRFIDISNAFIPPRKDPPKRFEHHAEEDIASLLEVTPGEVLIGSIDYHKKGRFVKSFKESLVSPTLTVGDDTPYMKELKRAVNEVKADLRERMDNGEDIAQIMEDSRNELQELGCYRMELEQELANIRKDSKTSLEDYEDFVKAANTMLESKGAKPLKIPKVIYNQFRLRNQRRSK